MKNLQLPLSILLLYIDHLWEANEVTSNCQSSDYASSPWSHLMEAGHLEEIPEIKYHSILNCLLLIKFK